MIGPTLLDLRQLVNASAQQINIIFPIGSIGYLLGSIAGGIVYDRFDSQLTIALFLIILGISEAVIPWNRSVMTLSVNNFLKRLGDGGINTSGNVWCLHIWGKSSAPFMQALHFSFGLGAFVSPLIAEPFLLPVSKNVTEDGDQIENVVEGADITVWWAYTIISIFALLVVILLIVMYLVKSSDKAHPTVERNQNKTELTLKQKILVLSLAALIFHVYCGLEIAFGRYITTYAFYSDLHLNKSIGAFMTSVFWGTFTFFRLLTVFIVELIGTRIMLWADLIVILVGNVVLIILGNYKHQRCIILSLHINSYRVTTKGLNHFNHL